jgi:hypothetical protein
MRFRSELLQPPKDDSQATLMRIYDVYMTPEVVSKARGKILETFSTMANPS